MHGHKSSIISTYLVLCRNARSTILLTMFSLPFLSRRARDQVMHRRWNPLWLVTALLSTSQPSLPRLLSSVWLSTTHCKPDLSFSKLTPPLFLHMYHRCPAQNIERETNIVRLLVAILGNLYRRACDMLRSVAWKFSKTLGKMLGSFGSQIGPPKRNRYR